MGPVPRSALCPIPESPLLAPSPPQPLRGQGMEGESEHLAPPRPPGRKGVPRAWPQGDTTVNNFATEFCNGHSLSTAKASGILQPSQRVIWLMPGQRDMGPSHGHLLDPQGLTLQPSRAEPSWRHEGLAESSGLWVTRFQSQLVHLAGDLGQVTSPLSGPQLFLYKKESN